MAIYGKYNFDFKEKISQELILRMSQRLKSKTTDKERIYIEDNIGLGICSFGSSESCQPIHNENTSLWLLADGEIYNYSELKKGLVKKNHFFKGSSDMEIIVHLYEEEGINCFNKLNGIFSLVIWDKNRRNLILVRDKLGVRQIYYSVMRNCVIFSSDIKAILEDKGFVKTIDFNSFYDYLSFGYIPSPKTIFNNITKLPPGYAITISDTDRQLKKYWDIPVLEDRSYSEEYYVEGLLDLMHKAVRRRFTGSQNSGLFLSGGLDSSTIVYTLTRISESPLRTFSIGFKEKYYDEAKYARIVSACFNTRHQHFLLPDDPLDCYENIIWSLGDIIAESTVIPYYFLGCYTSKEIGAAFSGEGGDELFAGYLTHLADILAPLYKKVPDFVKKYIISPLIQLIPDSQKPISLSYKARDFIYGAALPVERMHYHWREIFTEADKKELLNNTLLDGASFKESFLNYNNLIGTCEFKTRHTLDIALYNDLKINLADNILFFENSINKMNSLVVKTPFLDSDLVEFAMAIPAAMKIRNFKTKYILKKAMWNKLPRVILNKPKHGMSNPDKIWMRAKERNIILEVLLDHNTFKTGYFNSVYVRQLIRNHLEGKIDNSRKLWAIYTFLIWHKLFVR